jgi:hypothetical protein
MVPSQLGLASWQRLVQVGTNTDWINQRWTLTLTHCYFVLHFLVGLTAAGFTQSGIAAGSLAAATQSAIGNVSAGSLFAGLQSLGATGGIIGMLLTGAARMLISFLFVL